MKVGADTPPKLNTYGLSMTALVRKDLYSLILGERLTPLQLLRRTFYDRFAIIMKMHKDNLLELHDETIEFIKKVLYGKKF